MLTVQFRARSVSLTFCREIMFVGLLSVVGCQRWRRRTGGALVSILDVMGSTIWVDRQREDEERGAGLVWLDMDRKVCSAL